MNSLKNLGDQLAALWRQSTWRARVGFAAAIFFCLAVILGVGFWSSRPEFVTLAANLEPGQAAEIVSKLDAAAIDHQMNFSGSAVLVPKHEWNKAHVAIRDVSAPIASENEELGDSFLGDPTLNHYKILRRREQMLARTMMRMQPVASATVHIARPEPSPFVQEQRLTTASVVLELRGGVFFAKEQATTIQALVAGSVEGLEAKHVTVMDVRGRVLSADASDEADIGGQFEYRRSLESELAAKAEVMLAEMLGRGRAIVRVTADIDFTRTQRTETTYDPDMKVKKTERIKSVSRRRAAPGFTGAAPASGGAAAGPAGTGSNLANGGTTGQAQPMTESEEENNTEYETAKSVDTIQEASGKIKRLTIAATVDLAAVASAESGGKPAFTKGHVEALIKQAVGFDPARNDQIEVVVAGLPGIDATADAGLLKLEEWEFYTKLARNASLGIGALVALVLGLLVLRRVRPVTIASQPSVPTKLLEELASQARHHPEAVAGVIAAWLGETNKPQDVRGRTATSGKAQTVKAA